MVLDEDIKRAVNAAIVLRRPLLVTGKPGTGKSSLAYAIAHELDLDRVLVWSITSRSALQQGLYHYDAIARLQDASLAEARARAVQRDVAAGTGAAALPPAATPDIGRYIHLGPLGTALLTSRFDRPRVLLIDEIDKSDIDLPNDLLHVFEEGRFDIPELMRLPEEDAYKVIAVQPSDHGPLVSIRRGDAQCMAFPIVVLTSNGEREFPPAFLRRCIRLTIPEPSRKQIEDIVRSRLPETPEDLEASGISHLIKLFLDRRDGKGTDDRKKDLATDQLLNATYLLLHGYLKADPEEMRELILRPLADETAAESGR
jgi:MoxR-like ATPase